MIFFLIFITPPKFFGILFLNLILTQGSFLRAGNCKTGYFRVQEIFPNFATFREFAKIFCHENVVLKAKKPLYPKIRETFLSRTSRRRRRDFRKFSCREIFLFYSMSF